ncbi:MAG TPA: hypothetical protein VJ838_08995 [Gaiellaceae bacterium]|nr:hypothetical protein [Gaiellaceae bacterium]
MRRPSLAVILVLLAFATSATALSANGYTVWGTAWHRPPIGSLFSVLSHGVAPRKALLYVYLDRKPCTFTYAAEAKRFPSFKAGQSYFRDSGRAFITMWVSGHFSKAFTARAGTTAQPEYACSYLTIPNSQGRYRITSARRSNAYFVTN